MHPVLRLVHKLDDGEDEVLRLVEGIENLVLGDSDGARSGNPPFDLEEAQLARAGHRAFDVIAELLEFPVHGFEAETPLEFHHDSPGAGRAFLGIDDLPWKERWFPLHGQEETEGYHEEATLDHRGQGGDLRLESELFESLLEPTLEKVGTLPSLA